MFPSPALEPTNPPPLINSFQATGGLDFQVADRSMLSYPFAVLHNARLTCPVDTVWLQHTGCKTVYLLSPAGAYARFGGSPTQQEGKAG